jgi:hypothetical protein
MKKSSPVRAATAAAIIAVAGAAFAATAPVTDMPANSGAASPTSPTTYAYTHGTNRPTVDQSREPSNVTAAQDFQDKNNDAVDPNAKAKTAKAKKAKPRVAPRDTSGSATSSTTPQ